MLTIGDFNSFCGVFWDTLYMSHTSRYFFVLSFVLARAYFASEHQTGSLLIGKKALSVLRNFFFFHKSLVRQPCLVFDISLQGALVC